MIIYLLAKDEGLIILTRNKPKVFLKKQHQQKKVPNYHIPETSDSAQE